MWTINYNEVYIFFVLVASILICYQLLSVPLQVHKHESEVAWNEKNQPQETFLTSENVFLLLYSLPNLNRIHLSPDAGELDVERTFIAVSESMEVLCPKSVRIGNVGDGGWDVCEFGNLLPKEPCIVYSFGINDDWSFDDGIVEKYNCIVRSFDPSMPELNHWRNPKNVFLMEGLGGKDVILDNLWRMNTLKTIRNIFQDDDSLIDYLKFDIEGDEWAVLNTSIRDGSLRKVKQLAFEIHTDESHKETTPVYKLRFYLDLLKGLRDLGFYRWYAHRNMLAPKFPSDRSGVGIWCCHEVVYLNINYV